MEIPHTMAGYWLPKLLFNAPRSPVVKMALFASFAKPRVISTVAKQALIDMLVCDEHCQDSLPSGMTHLTINWLVAGSSVQTVLLNLTGSPVATVKALLPSTRSAPVQTEHQCPKTLFTLLNATYFASWDH